jgi:hypothetical protein
LLRRFPFVSTGVDVNSQSPQPLLGQRTAIILLLGVLTALGAGVLTVLAGGTIAGGVLTGGAAFAAAVLFFHTIIA